MVGLAVSTRFTSCNTGRHGGERLDSEEALAVDVYSVTQTSKRFVDETTQRANLGLAASIAREMQVDTVTGQVEAVGMNQLFMSAMTINPIVKLFVVDLDAIAGVVILLVGLLLTYLLTRHVRQLNLAVQNVQAGDFSARVAVQSSDEIGQLGTAFNSMAAKIESSLETLNRNDTLHRELVANISHDLHTPLASIEGYTETILLREHVLTEEERKTYLLTILRNTQSLGRLVSELFELSKLEARQTTLHIEPFSITELIRDNLLKFEPQANERAIQLSSNLPRHTPFVLADVGTTFSFQLPVYN